MMHNDSIFVFPLSKCPSIDFIDEKLFAIDQNEEKIQYLFYFNCPQRKLFGDHELRLLGQCYDAKLQQRSCVFNERFGLCNSILMLYLHSRLSSRSYFTGPLIDFIGNSFQRKSLNKMETDTIFSEKSAKFS